jgi:hypothetical protein
MALERGHNLKRLLKEAEPGRPLTTSRLAQMGVSAQLAHHYVENKWLDKLGHGVFLRAGDQPSLEKSLAVAAPKAHVGGKTALSWQGYKHNLYLREPVLLYSEARDRLPDWLTSRFPVELRRRRLFRTGESFAVGAQPEFSGTLLSEPERAVLEMLSEVPSRQSLTEAESILEMLHGLRPDIMQPLLENCVNVKAKRLFLNLAEQSGLPVLEDLNLEKIDLGADADYVLPIPGGSVRIPKPREA